MRRFFRATSLLLGNTVLLLLGIELILRSMFAVYDRPADATEPSPLPDWRCAADTYPRETWVSNLWTEFHQTEIVWSPYVYWRRAPFTGEYIHVDADGVRKTWQDRAASDDALDIFIFGGSTVWGTGARDTHTIPSLIARDLAERGHSVRITNFGESGYVSTQEVILLVQGLHHGRNPDLVVFYDGVNDTFSAYQQGTAGLPQNEFNREMEFNVLLEPERIAPQAIDHQLRQLAITRLADGLRWRIASRRSDKNPPGEDSGGDEPPQTLLAREVVHAYLSNIRIVRALGETYGFDTRFYWQPSIFNKTHRSRYENGAYRARRDMLGFFRAVNREMRVQVREVDGFDDLSQIFQDETRPVFVDWCHLGETGNDIIARRIAADLHAMITKRESTAL